MFKRGGFASYTKTGRRMQFGTAVGSVIAKGSNRSTSSREPPAFVKFMIAFICLFIIYNITKILTPMKV